MLAALGMAWGWCQPSPVTFCPLRAAVAPPASPEHLPLHMLCCRALILHIQSIPSLLKPALEALLRGVWAVRVCIWAVCTGPVPEFVCGVTGVPGRARRRARPPPSTAALRSCCRATRSGRQRSLSSPPATPPPSPFPSRCLPGAAVRRAVRRAERRAPETPAPSVPWGAGPAMPFE